MKRTYTVYAIVHIDSGCRYVGSTSAMKRRWDHHKNSLKANKHHCEALQNAWNEFGEAAFRLDVLQSFPWEDSQDRFARELEFINSASCYNSVVTATGRNNFETTDETKLAISKGHRTKLANDPEHAEKMRQVGLNVGAYMKTDEARAEVGRRITELWKDPDHRESVSTALAKHWSTPGVREEHSERVKAVRARPEVKENVKKGLKSAWADPNSGFHTRNNNRWADPAAREATSKRMTELHAKRRQEKAAKAAALLNPES